MTAVHRRRPRPGQPADVPWTAGEMKPARVSAGPSPVGKPVADGPPSTTPTTGEGDASTDPTEGEEAWLTTNSAPSSVDRRRTLARELRVGQAFVDGIRQTWSDDDVNDPCRTFTTQYVSTLHRLVDMQQEMINILAQRALHDQGPAQRADERLHARRWRMLTVVVRERATRRPPDRGTMRRGSVSRLSYGRDVSRGRTTLTAPTTGEGDASADPTKPKNRAHPVEAPAEIRRRFLGLEAGRAHRRPQRERIRSSTSRLRPRPCSTGPMR